MKTLRTANSHSHPFEERCKLLKEETGIEVPVSVVECFKRYDLPTETNTINLIKHS